MRTGENFFDASTGFKCGKSLALVPLESIHPKPHFKCDPQQGHELRETYARKIIPGTISAQDIGKYLYLEG